MISWRALVASSMVAVMGGAGCATRGHRAAKFHGDGPLVDSGLWSYPRYHLPVGRFPLSEAGTYAFQFTGVPVKELSLQLDVEPYAEAHRMLLEGLTTELAVTIADDQGVAVCEARGTPLAGRAGGWVLMSAGARGAFWHSSCVDRRFRRARSYSLSVTVGRPDARTPQSWLHACLEGGGVELP
jgi:hypothetical protein